MLVTRLKSSPASITTPYCSEPGVTATTSPLKIELYLLTAFESQLPAGPVEEHPIYTPASGLSFALNPPTLS